MASYILQESGLRADYIQNQKRQLTATEGVVDRVNKKKPRTREKTAIDIFRADYQVAQKSIDRGFNWLFRRTDREEVDAAWAVANDEKETYAARVARSLSAKDAKC